MLVVMVDKSIYSIVAQHLQWTGQVAVTVG